MGEPSTYTTGGEALRHTLPMPEREMPGDTAMCRTGHSLRPCRPAATPSHPALWGRRCILHAAAFVLFISQPLPQVCDATILVIGAASLRRSVGTAFLSVSGEPASCRSRRSCCQRLGTERTGTDPGTGSAGNIVLPTVIRCRFRSTIAVPIPFTCVRSSTR